MLRSNMRNMFYSVVCLAYCVLIVESESHENGPEIIKDSEVSSDTSFHLRINSSVVYEEDVTAAPISPLNNVEHSWNPPSVNPIFQVFRDFLFQERPSARSLPEEPFSSSSITPEVTSQTTSEEPEILSSTIADRVLEMINNNIQEAMTTITEEIEAVTSIDSIIQNTEESTEETQTEAAPLWDLFGFNRSPTTRKTDNLVNLTKSCTSCYAQLSSCVHQCFVQHDCRNVERNARKCPGAAASFCNPFSPWSSADDCHVDSDCDSPLLCCDDGCVKKCTAGVWKT